MVSIIYSALNVNKKFKVSLESIVNQTIKDFEIIIVGNSTLVEKMPLIEKYQQAGSNISTHTIGDDKSVFYSRLFGVKKAKGDYLFFIDSSDYIKTCYLELLLKNMKDATIGTTSFQRFSDHGNLAKVQYKTALLTGNKKYAKNEISMFRIWNSLVKTDFFKQFIKEEEDLSSYNGTTLMIGLIANCNKYYRYNETLYYRGVGNKKWVEFKYDNLVDSILRCQQFNLPQTIYKNLLIDELLITTTTRMFKSNCTKQEIEKVVEVVRSKIPKLYLNLLLMRRPLDYKRAAVEILNQNYPRAVKLLEKLDI